MIILFSILLLFASALPAILCSQPLNTEEVPCKTFNITRVDNSTRYIIRSPRFPNNYVKEAQVCGWKFEIPKQSQVKQDLIVECPQFHVGKADKKGYCTGDAIHVLGHFSKGHLSFCGEHARLKTSAQADSNNLVTIKFETIEQSEYPGFSCEVYTEDNHKMMEETHHSIGSYSPNDPHSFSMPDEAKVTHMHLDLTIDFSTETLDGSVTLTVEKVKPNVTDLVLDARYLDIQSVEDEKTGQPLDFRYGKEHYVGAKMEIDLPTSDPEPKVKIFYKTTTKTTGLVWLKPKQTAGKDNPYLFSINKFINTRTMVPCQDTPSTKTTYSANITAPSHLTVLMSALPQGDPQPGPTAGTKVHRFLQKIPIQSYLIAIVAGNLVSRKIGPRSRVWSEKEFVDKAAFEFEDTESMLKEAENLCGPYVWGVYDILVLPPSFAFGGLENPHLTYATPTILAGDKSMGNVIAHEIAHSWSGNLVTNKNVEHYWLCEGFTVFTERKIIGRLYGGKPARDFAAIVGWKDLKDDIDRLKEDNPWTALVTDLEGVNPVDSFSILPYEKGSTFLWYLEDLVGGPQVFEPFLITFYKAFNLKSLDSYDFKDFFVNYFKDVEAIKEVKWDTWFNKPGMPPYKPKFDESLAVLCQELSARWVEYDKTGCPDDFKTEDISRFSSSQKIVFLDILLEEQPLNISTLEQMQQAYNLSSVENSEIKARWIRLGLRGKWEDAIPRATKMLTEQGRMKFLRPIYRGLYGWEEKGRKVALDTFQRNKGSMMKVAVRGVKKDLNLA